MKVQLIVVQGRPEGKVIPLVGPVFKIGRGETCNLRPNSEQVSREHAEFNVSGDRVTVRDLGSRNGTLVNGKAQTGACELKDRDLVQVGPLTFAVSISGAPSSARASVQGPSGKAAPEDVSHDDIESWLIADGKNPAPERPSGIYGGETITINAFKDGAEPKPEPKPAAKPEPRPAARPEPKPEPEPKPAPRVEAKPAPKPAPAPAPAPPPPPVAEDDDVEYERLPEGEGDPEEEAVEGSEDHAEEEAAVEEFVDESNPFYVKKKAPEAPTGPTKPVYKDTSDAASDILRKMMERRRGPR